MTQYCTFTLGDLHFGIPTLHVQEVIRNRDMTPIPLAPAAVQGLINLRGQIVTAIDLGHRLELDRADDAAPSMHVVVSVEGAAVSLLVDAIGDVVDAEQSTFERPPDTLDAAARELILGVHKLEGQLLLVLDVAKAVDVSPAAAA